MPIPPKYAGGADESHDSGILWSAIIGGALAATGLSLILTPIGAALGFPITSAWHHVEASRTVTTMSAVWLIIVQWLSFGLGGYLTGRLRTEWVGAHTHEVFFRDTAHGFLSWALVSLAGTLFVVATAVHTAHVNGAPAEDVSTSVVLLYSLSMFVGAFIASAAGALGGIHRDFHYQTGRLSG